MTDYESKCKEMSMRDENDVENEYENENMNVSMNLLDVLFGPPRTGGSLKSRMCEPAGQ